ncbi:MAG: MMPL family transporter, partial [Thermoplasmata archaeon]|nr:MMPL family transporter [Thermoplasmata archaeon]
TMLFSILMGVGTDYAIFIVARYREERIKGHGREDAVRTSITWAGESISTSGATVMISFFALSISDFSMIRTMGLVLGMAIGISLIVALTLVPSLLLLLGNRIFWPTRGQRWKKFAENVMAKRAQGHRSYFRKAATFSINHAKAVMLVAILISVPTTYVFLTAETSFDFISGMSSGAESNEGITAMTDGFGAGRIMPTEIVVIFDSPVYVDGNFSMPSLDAVALVTASMSNVENVKQVTGTTNPRGSPIDYRNLSMLSSETRASQESLMLETIGLDQRTVLITVILETGPMTSDSIATIDDIRGLIATLKADDPSLASAVVYVGGATAVIADLAKDLNEQFTIMEVVVVIGIFIVLLIVLRAVLLSLFAIISIMLSISWAFAATVLLFGYSLNEPILWIAPLILFIMLMGIGMDYNIFILTRIREEMHKGRSDRDAIVESLDWTGGIITALAVIMGSAFAMMMISSTVMLKEIGFALGFAILLDAMVVRTYIVPAMMTLLGKWGWWAPGPLQRERRKERAFRDLKE